MNERPSEEYAVFTARLLADMAKVIGIHKDAGAMLMIQPEVYAKLLPALIKARYRMQHRKARAAAKAISAITDLGFMRDGFEPIYVKLLHCDPHYIAHSIVCHRTVNPANGDRAKGKWSVVHLSYDTIIKGWQSSTIEMVIYRLMNGHPAINADPHMDPCGWYVSIVTAERPQNQARIGRAVPLG